MRDISELNEFTQKELRKILAKDAIELVPGEVAFLRARRDYLSSDMREKFADLLETKKVKAEKPVEEKPKKSGK
jgi:hypothetical protein